MNQLISEMKRYGVGPDDIHDALEETNSYLKLKLSDIEEIFNSYERKIEDRFIDSEDYMLFYGELMAKSELLEGAEVWVYGFDTFTSLNIQVLGHILRKAHNLNVVMTYEKEASTANDARVLTTGEGELLFKLTENIIDTLTEMAEQSSCTYELQSIDEVAKAEGTAPSIKETIWRDEKADTKISLVRASNIYAEADRVAAHIQDLVRDKGYRYSDIAVICNDMDVRGSVLIRTLDKWGIPAFGDKKRRVLHQPVVRFLLSFLDILAKGFEDGAIMGLIASGLLAWNREDEELMVNYISEAHIHAGKWKKEFTWTDKTSFGKDMHKARYSEDELIRLNEMRVFVLGIIEKAKNEIGRRNTAADKVAGLYQFLNVEFDIESRIAEIIDKQQDLNLLEGAAETAQSWSMICGLLNQVVNTIGEEKISNEQLKKILSAGLEEMEIGIVPTSTDCIIIGTLQRTRISRVKSLIVTASNEGILPMAAVDAGLLTERELETLEEFKLKICKREEIRLQEEQLAIYRLFSLPEDDLYVSCSLADQDGKAIVPSAIFNALSENSKGEVLGDLGSKHDTMELLASKEGSLSYMADAMRRYLENGNISNEWLIAMNWYEEKAADSIDRIKQGISFENKLNELGQDLADSLYFGDKDQIYVSASRLETYAGCPFRFFIDKGLKAEEARKYEIDGRSRGDMFHEALQEFAMTLMPEDNSPVIDSSSKWMTITREECRAGVKEILHRKAGDYREGVFVDDMRNRFQLERIIDNCGDMAWAMVEQVRRSRTKQMYFEEPFGFDGQHLKPIEIELSNGKKAILNGRIDRLDVLEVTNENGDGTPESDSENGDGSLEAANKNSDEVPEKYDAVRVIDYKTGSDSIDIDHIESGYKLQLMVYMNAAVGGRFTADSEESAGEKQGSDKPDGVKLDSELTDSEESAGEKQGSDKPDGTKLDNELTDSEGSTVEKQGDEMPDSTMRPAGAFYFKINELDTNADSDSASNEIKTSLEERINKACRLEGVFIGEEDILLAMDDEIEAGKASTSIPIRLKKDGTVESYSSSAMLSKEEFEAIRRQTIEHVKEICFEIQEGKIDISPKREVKSATPNGSPKTSCTYCNYKSICLFDTSFRQCKYEKV